MITPAMYLLQLSDIPIQLQFRKPMKIMAIDSKLENNFTFHWVRYTNAIDTLDSDMPCERK